MRFIIVGVGAIGGSVAVLLADSGQDVVGVARGRQLEAIRASGLTLHTPAGTRTARIECAGAASEIDFRPDDMILLATKTQDTEDVLAQLRDAGVTDQAVFCLQNGVENERLALRRFPNVHGVTVMLPADLAGPGEIAAFGAPMTGIFEIGRYPGGFDAADEALAAALTPAGIVSETAPDVMAGKYGKLIMNLGNIVEASLGAGDFDDIREALRAEGRAVLKAAGISWRDVGLSDPRRAESMKISPIEGVSRIGSSTTQSLARGTGSIETDFLNGEIALLGRLHGVATPANGWFCDLAARMVRDRAMPGSVTRETVEAALVERGVTLDA